ncbi:hypothetical protein SAMN05421788_101537 [Filimonas lacunae]|uniref:Uncharacterized protein n=1 Tax=Filimonas lacunae TaxID=477680 RepID=A0A173MNW9_9BACT|nr:hypothetical protein [Filimonas lacunae]BAV09091.1 hypothetical protein FLA_5139 [Filimonas lacunae]SIS67156.1 hypothetical protein SAMN05421788_101537 [Filimonas lacunae]
MPQLKRKPKSNQAKKQAEILHKKEFISKLTAFIDKAAGEPVSKLIPKPDLDFMYHFRANPLRIECAPGQKIPGNILKSCREISQDLFDNELIPFRIGAINMLNLKDFTSLALTVSLFTKHLQADSFPHAHIVQQKLAGFHEKFNFSYLSSFPELLDRIMTTISAFHSEASKQYYQCLLTSKDGITSTTILVNCYAIPAEKTQICIKNKVRPIYHVATGLSNMQGQTPSYNTLLFVSVLSEDLFLPPGQIFDVYIQSHAIERLQERLQGVHKNFIHCCFFISLNNLKICKTKNGTLLFEYYLLGNKAGYFTGEIVDNKVILTTFLFLTHTSTPEGDKLYQKHQLTKLDKNYLSIDTLKAFVFSDIATHPEVKQLFIEAGCESLFNIGKGLYHNQEEQTEVQIANTILQYLRQK